MGPPPPQTPASHLYSVLHWAYVPFPLLDSKFCKSREYVFSFPCDCLSSHESSKPPCSVELVTWRLSSMGQSGANTSLPHPLLHPGISLNPTDRLPLVMKPTGTISQSIHPSRTRSCGRDPEQSTGKRHQQASQHLDHSP